MRRLLLSLPFALLPLVAVHADEHDHDHEHGSLGAHEHGVAQLNVALDGKTLELELESPAMNLVGFEHVATSDADKAKVVATRTALDTPLELFAIPTEAGCTVTSRELESPLFDNAHHDDEASKGHDHSDIHAHYTLVCATPEALQALDITPLLKRFPATQKIQVQLIGPNGQQGAELSATNASLSF
ncbi:DUF2796 domain-containing protein [Pseudomonas sp. LFM046]|uniref:DUF2796 domain-containing protein n=1 Tax=Pseudomonas sp. LFM046 TaxID=1608357 RepID=UPI0005CFBA4D|nr:DUF2796 domain-containing protein [Pseudomonas sp. LFM046]